MTALRAIFPFNAHGIWVERELLGHSYSTEEQGMPVHLTLPSDRDDFRTWQLLPGEGYWAIGAPSSGTVDDPDQRVSIYVVQISVDIDAAIDEATVRSGGRDEAEVAITAFDSAFEVATKVMRDFLAWVRTDRQSWIGLSSEGPELAGPGSLMDVAADARVPVGHTQRISSMLRGDSPLDATRLGELWSHVESGDAPPVAETLLADAEHLAWAGGDPPDPLRSVLMAAIACEVKVKAVLRQKIDPAQEPLLEFILDNPREITLNAVDGMFNKLMDVAQGRSLRKDNRELFKKIVRLFELRNDVAHRGARPSEAQARELVGAAREAFIWLDAAEEPDDSGTD